MASKTGLILAAVIGGYLLIKPRTLSDVELVQQWEGLRLTPYRDAAGLWTVGYGHLLGPGEPVESITHERAVELLDQDLQTARAAVDRLVTVPLTDQQRAALVSFVFNVGEGAFARSTLLRLLNAGDYDGAADQFTRWVYAGGQRLAGLENRRRHEQQVFLA